MCEQKQSFANEIEYFLAATNEIESSEEKNP